MPGQALQGLRQLRLAQQMAFGWQVPVVEKQPRALRIVTQRREAPAGALAIDGIHRKSVAGQGDGRRQGGLQGQAAALLRELDQCGRRAGYRRGQRAIQRKLAPDLAVAQVHIRRGSGGCALAGVEETVLGGFAGFAQQKEAAAAKSGAVWLDHRQGGADCNGGIEGVAAGFENAPANFTGQRMGRGDGAVCKRVALGRAGQQQEGGETTLEAPEQADPSGRSPREHHALPVMIRYFCISSSLLSTLFSSSGMQSTGQTCWHCGSS